MKETTWQRWGKATAVVLALAGPSLLYAQTYDQEKRDQAQQYDRADQGRMSSSPTVIHGEKLIGQRVHNPQGENLGKIEDVVLDVERGQIAYAVLSFGGFLGMGDKFFAIPWQALQIQGTNQPVILNISKEQLRQSKGFDKSNWPDMASPNFATQTYQQYGYQPYFQQGQPQLNRQKFWVNRLSKLDDINVNDAAGKKIGEVRDILIDTRQGRAAYALIDLSGQNKDVAVPWNALRLDPNKKVYIVEADEQTLKSMAFDRNSPPSFADETWGRQTASRFQRQPYWEALGYSGTAGAAAGQMGYGRLFESAPSTTIEGEITDVQTYAVSPNLNDGVRLQVKTSDGRTTYVDLGSRSKLEKQDVRFRAGDHIKVTGQELHLFRATQVQVGDQTLQIRQGMER